MYTSKRTQAVLSSDCYYAALLRQGLYVVNQAMEYALEEQCRFGHIVNTDEALLVEVQRRTRLPAVSTEEIHDAVSAMNGSHDCVHAVRVGYEDGSRLGYILIRDIIEDVDRGFFTLDVYIKLVNKVRDAVVLLKRSYGQRGALDESYRYAHKAEALYLLVSDWENILVENLDLPVRVKLIGFIPWEARKMYQRAAALLQSELVAAGANGVLQVRLATPTTLVEEGSRLFASVDDFLAGYPEGMKHLRRTDDIIMADIEVALWNRFHELLTSLQTVGR